QPRAKGSRQRLTDRDRARFREVLEASGSVPQAAAAIGISPPTAYQLARQCGWQPQPGVRRSRISADQRQQFREVLDRTMRVKDAAAAIGISLPTAYQLAKEFGCSSTRSDPRRQYTADDRQRAIAAYERLGNVAAVAREVEMGYSACRARLQDAGYDLSGNNRQAYLTLRAQGVTRVQAAEQVGVHERTAQDYDAGIRRLGSRRLYPDGRVVDYRTGMTTFITHQAAGDSGGAQLSTRPQPAPID